MRKCLKKARSLAASRDKRSAAAEERDNKIPEEQYQRLQEEATQRRIAFRAQVRRLRTITDKKERQTRMRWQEDMIKERSTASFWRKVALFDTDDGTKKGGVGDSSRQAPDLATFARHFAEIAIPPSCEFFDD